jgi:hypothetical protein
MTDFKVITPHATMITWNYIRMASAVTVAVGSLFVGNRLGADEPTRGGGRPTSLELPKNRSFSDGFHYPFGQSIATNCKWRWLPDFGHRALLDFGRPVSYNSASKVIQNAQLAHFGQDCRAATLVLH